MDVRVVTEAFDPLEEIQNFRQNHKTLATSCGAMVVFMGTMRDHNEGEAVSAMKLEHYPEMTQTYLQELTQQAQQRYGLADVLLRHRVGELSPGDDIVLIAVWAEHRKAAYEGNRFLMEALKSSAPFWKQEELEDGRRRWVECNTQS